MAGQLAPVCLLLVGALLYLFTAIYAEACTAFPLNGGTYNLLLNTTTKTIAALAACLTLLSYTATAVVSAAESVTYAYNLYPSISVYWFTILLMASVCALAILGIVESAVVALAIFILHMGSMVALVIVGGMYALQNQDIFWANLALPLRYSPNDRAVVLTMRPHFTQAPPSCDSWNALDALEPQAAAPRCRIAPLHHTRARSRPSRTAPPPRP